MKRITHVWLAAVMLMGTMASLASAQTSSSLDSNPQDPSTLGPSLGDYVRSHKKEKKQTAVKQFDNDNLPTQDKLNIVGGGAQSSSTTQTASQDEGKPVTDAAAAGNQADKAEKMPTVEAGQSQEDRQKVYDRWQEKISTQKEKVDSLSHDLDMLQREYRLRAAEMYGDAGSRLRNQGAWDKEDADFKQKMDAKQKEINEAKQQIDDMQEDARKAGVPSSVREAQPEAPQQ